MLRVIQALAGRELIRFLRQPQRVIGSLGQPILFWVFLGSGFTPSFRAPGLEKLSYLEYFFPGVLLMMLLFASIFSSITLIEDRDQGFLQGVLTAPVPRMAIVLGKVGGGTAIALFQSFILLIAAPFVLPIPSLGGGILLLAALVLTGVGFSALGFMIAWTMKSTSGFHAIMMVFLMPLWMLSGALFPMDNAPGWLWGAMIVNPVSHALVLIRAPFYADAPAMLNSSLYLTSLFVTLGWAGLCLFFSLARVERVERGVTG
jgi:ABC-2 type transport system permease protein